MPPTGSTASPAGDGPTTNEKLAAAFRKFEERYARLQAGEDEPDETAQAMKETFRNFENKLAELKRRRQTEGAASLSGALADAFTRFEKNYTALEEERDRGAKTKTAFAPRQSTEDMSSSNPVRRVGSARQF